MSERALIVDKGDDGEVIPADLADRLREPVEGEAQLLAEMAKTGASEDDLDALAGAIRLLDSAGANVSTTIAKAETETPKLTLNSPEERRRLAEEARRTNERIQRFAKEARVKKAAEQAAPKRTAADALASVERIEKQIQIRDDSHSLERLEKSAENIRRADPSLSKSQAMVRAMHLAPEEYSAYARHQARQAGWLNDGPDEIRKADEIESVLDRAAQPYLDADSTLTKQQAVAKALHADKSLYERTTTIIQRKGWA